MSTRAVIIQRSVGDDPGRFIVVKDDGNPGGVGATLLAHYSTRNRVDLLMSTGSMLTLGRHLSSEFLPEEELKHVCTGTGGPTTQLWKGVKIDNVRGNCGADYAYVYDGDEWYVYRPGAENGTALALAIRQEQAEYEAWCAKLRAEQRKAE